MIDPTVSDRVARAYGGSQVLVTGGASFIGSHLVEALCAAGAKVRVADDLSSGRLEHLSAVAADIDFLEGDLRDPAVAARAAEGREVVFHLAAAHGGRGYIDTHPVEMMNNMVLDHQVLSAVAAAGARKVITASSACVYPTTLQATEDQGLLLAETDANFDEQGGAYADGEYGWYKLMGELQLRSIHKQYGCDGIACRVFTAYGERENESHAVVALIAKAVARLDPFPVWGNGLQTRNFTYVGDTITGLLLAGAELSGFDVINVGTDAHHTIRDLNEVIFKHLDWRPEEIDYQLDKPVGVRSRAASIEKSQKLLGWAPSDTLEHGVTRTVDWYASTVSPERLERLNDLLMTR